MTHSVVAQTSSLLQQLRQATFTGLAEESRHVSHNVYFCWDKANGAADITVTSVEGGLLSADIAVSGAPDWFTLNIGLGFGAFRAGETLGLALSASSTAQTVLRPFVRSVVAGEGHDTHLTDPIRLALSPGGILLLHTIQPYEALAWAQEFHTLIIPLPKQSFRLDLQDMRLFHATGPAAPSAQPGTMAALAA